MTTWLEAGQPSVPSEETSENDNENTRQAPSELNSASPHRAPGHGRQNKWRVKVQDRTMIIQNTFKPASGLLSYRGRKVHGSCDLPEGYELAILPPGSPVKENHLAEIVSSDRRGPLQTELSSSYSLSKGLVAIFQTLWASVTLWRTRGNQVDEYGYAAFGLTVAPYLVMSLVNLISIVLTPNYSVVYLVHTDIMEEAQRRGAHFEGIVGQITSNAEDYKPGDYNAKFEIHDGRTIVHITGGHATEGMVELASGGEQAEAFEVDDGVASTANAIMVPSQFGRVFSSGWKSLLNLALIFYGSILIGLISVAINGGISGFKKGNSTQAQRIWTMTWLAFGIFLGPTYTFGKFLQWLDSFRSLPKAMPLELLFLFYAAPAIGGFVVVAQMLNSYGRCIRIY